MNLTYLKDMIINDKYHILKHKNETAEEYELKRKALKHEKTLNNIKEETELIKKIT